MNVCSRPVSTWCTFLYTTSMSLHRAFVKKKKREWGRAKKESFPRQTKRTCWNEKEWRGAFWREGQNIAWEGAAKWGKKRQRKGKTYPRQLKRLYSQVPISCCNINPSPTFSLRLFPPLSRHFSSFTLPPSLPLFSLIFLLSLLFISNVNDILYFSLRL